MIVFGNYNSGIAQTNGVQKKPETSEVLIPNDSKKIDELKHQRELMSKECAYATKATAMAQVLMGTKLKFTTTPDEYNAQLIKQGKIPNKDFYVQKDEIATSFVELNSDGEKTKEVSFLKWSDGQSRVDCKFYNPKTQKEYKSVEYHQDGGVFITNGNPLSGRLTTSDKYRSDGSLEYHRDMDKMTDTHVSKGGKITTFSLENEKGEFVDKYFDDYGNQIYEGTR